jgi:hypothetical protein
MQVGDDETVGIDDEASSQALLAAIAARDGNDNDRLPRLLRELF